MEKQSVTSACTSINKNKLPAVYGKISLEGCDIVLDYGCGKYVEHICKYVQSKHCGYFPYDPYNQPSGINHITEFSLTEHKANIGIISNVLNVIDSDTAIKEALEKVLSLVSGKIYITVYEGNKSGVGKYTGNDSYQRNMKTREYIPLLEKLGFNPTIKSGMIILEN